MFNTVSRMTEQFSVVTQSVVSVNVTSPANAFGNERRFKKDLLICDLKGKLEMIVGSVAANMKLELYDKENKLICKMDNNEAMLGSYPIEDGMRIHVVDPTIKLGEFDDLSKGPKYELADEDYVKKTDTVRAFKEKNKLGRFKEVDPEEQKRKEEEKAQKEQADKDKVESMKIGDRCEVRVKNQPSRRGTVKYLGLTEFQEGYWVGVHYDEPFGKNDGSVKGKRYFECPDKYGGFVRPSDVTVGDFPEEDFDLDDDEM